MVSTDVRPGPPSLLFYPIITITTAAAVVTIIHNYSKSGIVGIYSALRVFENQLIHTYLL